MKYNTMNNKPRIYLGCTIERNFPSGMYYAMTSQGRVLADTLAGIKSLIKEREIK